MLEKTILFWTAVTASGKWSWEAGPSTVGAPLSDNDPAARCCSQSWSATVSSSDSTESNELLFLFGGSSDVFLGDMWCFNTQTREWSVVFGGGSFRANNGGNMSVPSARSYAVTWTLSNPHGDGDELWMWGGFGSLNDSDVEGHLLSDMWRFKLNADTQNIGWEQVIQSGLQPPARNWANFFSVGATLYLHSGMGGKLTSWGGFAKPLSDLWQFEVNMTATSSSTAPTGTWSNIYDYSDLNPGVVYDGNFRSPGYRSNAYTASGAIPSESVIKPMAPTLWLYGGEGGLTTKLPNGTWIKSESYFVGSCPLIFIFMLSIWIRIE